MGKAFALKTFAAVGLLSLFTHFLPQGLHFDRLARPLAAVLGGLNVLVPHLQECLGWRAGKVQMAMDGLIVLGALMVADGERVAPSVLGALVLNLTLAINHRPGRYMAI